MTTSSHYDERIAATITAAREKLQDQPAWHPAAIGELFTLVMPNGSRVLMRVTAIGDRSRWDATQASLAEAVTVTDVDALPCHHFRQEGVPA